MPPPPERRCCTVPLPVPEPCQQEAAWLVRTPERKRQGGGGEMVPATWMFACTGHAQMWSQRLDPAHVRPLTAQDVENTCPRCSEACTEGLTLCPSCEFEKRMRAKALDPGPSDSLLDPPQPYPNLDLPDLLKGVVAFLRLAAQRMSGEWPAAACRWALELEGAARSTLQARAELARAGQAGISVDDVHRLADTLGRVMVRCGFKGLNERQA